MKPAKFWATLSPQEKRDLAKKLKKVVASLSNIFGGRCKASPKLCLKIEKVTNGDVKPYELRKDIFKKE